MDRQEALKIYAQGVSRERERYLEQRVLQKAGRMSHQEKTKYVQSQGFENAVYQLKRRDKVYQGLRRGELSSDFYQTEFDTLAPLIIEDGFRAPVPAAGGGTGESGFAAFPALSGEKQDLPFACPCRAWAYGAGCSGSLLQTEFQTLRAYGGQHDGALSAARGRD